MKYKEYFSKLKEQGKIDNAEYAKFLETVPEGELPDDVFKVLEDTFMTAERAITHKDVNTKLRRQILDPVDNDIKNILKHLPAEVVMDVEREESTYKKLAALTNGLPVAFQKLAKAPDDVEAKKKIEEQKQIIQDLTSKFEKANGEFTEREKKIKSEYDGKFKNYQLDTELEKLSNSYTFADAYKDSRPALTKALLSEIKQKNKLDLVEKDGGFSIQVLDETGAPRFNGNTPVTVQSLLEEPFKPFLKQNNADGKTDGKQAQATQSYKVESQNPAIRRGATTSVEI